MAQETFEVRRRSSRVFCRLSVLVAGKNRDHRRFRDKAQTIVVNAHGGLLYLDQPLSVGQDVTLMHPETMEELECRVVYLGEAGDKGQRVGVEFLTPAPRFWGLELEPKDWVGKEKTSVN